MRFITFFIVFLSLSASAIETDAVTHINFEQALFEHLQEDYLKAISISELLSEKNNQRSIKQQVLLSNSYFNYRLPNVSLTLLKRTLKTELTKSDQDVLLFYIAKNHYDSQQFELALEGFKNIIEPINPTIVNQLYYLISDIQIRNNTLDLAEKTALKLQGNVDYFPYIAHNLAIALLNKGALTKALIWVNKLNEEPYANFKDLKNSLLLATGISSLRQNKTNEAILLLLQISKDSAYSAKGLLALGQALMQNNSVEEGSRFYNYLSNYPKQNLYYQESLLYLAESSQADSAKILLKHAINNYNSLLTELDALMSHDISDGLSHCLLNTIDNLLCNNTLLWTNSIKSTPAFNTGIVQHKQLLDIQNQLVNWSQKFPVFEFILNQRKDDFNHKLPLAMSKINPTYLTELKQQFIELKQQVDQIKHEEIPFSLMSEDEADHLDDIEYVEVTVKRINKASIKEHKNRAQFTKGILMWNLAQQQPIRFRAVQKNINDVAQLLKASSKGMKNLQQFNDVGDIRISQLQNTMSQSKKTLQQMKNKVDSLIIENQHHLSQLTNAYLFKRKSILIHLNSRSKYLLTQLQDVQK